jgi:hypothetical protein
MPDEPANELSELMQTFRNHALVGAIALLSLLLDRFCCCDVGLAVLFSCTLGEWIQDCFPSRRQGEQAFEALFDFSFIGGDV